MNEEHPVCSVCGAEMLDGYMDNSGGYACSDECLKVMLDKECGPDNWEGRPDCGENDGYYYNLTTGEDTGWFYTDWL